MIIGTKGEQPFAITDKRVSQKHCEVTKLADGKYHIKDLGSLNGTYVDGFKIVEQDVNHANNIMLAGIYQLDLTKCFPAPPPPLVFPERLRKIYEEYTTEKHKLNRKQKNKQNIRMMVMSAGGLLGLLSYWGIDQNTTRIIAILLSSIAFLIPLSSIVFGSDKTEQQITNLKNKFMKDYADGNCNKFLGDFPPDYFENNLKCKCTNCRKPIT